MHANVTAIYDKPTLLDQQTVFTSADGCFQLNDDLMKLMIYQVDIQVSMLGYQPYTCADVSCQINLYNTYKYAFPSTIVLTPYYVNLEIVLDVITVNG
jgi:hypothetical protein